MALFIKKDFQRNERLRRCLLANSLSEDRRRQLLSFGPSVECIIADEEADNNQI